MCSVVTATTLDKYICEMFLDDVPAGQIAKHFGLELKIVKRVLVEQFGSSNYRDHTLNKRRHSSLTMPKITEPDLFACQLALLANISERHFYDFVATVRQNSPDTYNGIDTETKKFRTTPDIDNEETDLECHHTWYPLIHTWRYRNL